MWGFHSCEVWCHWGVQPGSRAQGGHKGEMSCSSSWGKKKTNLAQGLRISVELCNSDLRPEEHGVCPRDYAGPRPVSTDYRG